MLQLVKMIEQGPDIKSVRQCFYKERFSYRSTIAIKLLAKHTAIPVQHRLSADYDTLFLRKLGLLVLLFAYKKLGRYFHHQIIMYLVWSENEKKITQLDEPLERLYSNEGVVVRFSLIAKCVEQHGSQYRRYAGAISLLFWLYLQDRQKRYCTMQYGRHNETVAFLTNWMQSACWLQSPNAEEGIYLWIFKSFCRSETKRKLELIREDCSLFWSF